MINFLLSSILPYHESGNQPAKVGVNAINPDAIAYTLAPLLRENIREQMANCIDKMRNELGALQVNANEPNGRAVRKDIQRISEEIQAHQVASSEQFDDMAGELRGIQRDIHSIVGNRQQELDAHHISNKIQVGHDEIAKKIDGLGSSEVDDQIIVLRDKLETVKQSMASTAPPTPLRIDDELQALGEGISTLVEATRAVVASASVTELSNGIDQAVSAEQAAQQIRAQNEPSITEGLQSIGARVGSNDPAQSNTNDKTHNLQLLALEEQMSSIAAQLQSIGARSGLSITESRLSGIEE